MAYSLERSPDGGIRWIPLVVGGFQFHPNDFQGPSGKIPDSVAPGYKSALAGVPGEPYECRLCWVADGKSIEVERWKWASIPEDPNDPNSFRVWGWEPVSRNYEAVPEIIEARGEFSFLGG